VSETECGTFAIRAGGRKGAEWAASVCGTCHSKWKNHGRGGAHGTDPVDQNGGWLSSTKYNQVGVEETGRKVFRRWCGVVARGDEGGEGEQGGGTEGRGFGRPVVC
jgi:hypothetical protein